MAFAAAPSKLCTRTAVRLSAGRKSTVRVAATVTAEKASLDITKMTPIHDRVLIRPLDDEQRTPGGILLPKGPPKPNSDAHIGEVLAIGGDVTLSLAKGDVVVFQKYAMAEVEVKEGQILFVAEKSIMGKLE